MATVNYTALKQVTGRQELKVVIAQPLEVSLTMIEEIAIMNGVKPEKKDVLINRLVEEYANKVISDMDVMDLATYSQQTKKVDGAAQDLATKIIPVKLMNQLPTRGKGRNEQEQRVGEVNE